MNEYPFPDYCGLLLEFVSDPSRQRFLAIGPQYHTFNPLMHRAIWRTDRPDVKIKNDGLGQYGAEPLYSALLFWQLCALKVVSCKCLSLNITRLTNLCFIKLFVCLFGIGHTVHNRLALIRRLIEPLPIFFSEANLQPCL